MALIHVLPQVVNHFKTTVQSLVSAGGGRYNITLSKVSPPTLPSADGTLLVLGDSGFDRNRIFGWDSISGNTLMGCYLDNESTLPEEGNIVECSFGSVEYEMIRENEEDLEERVSAAQVDASSALILAGAHAARHVGGDDPLYRSGSGDPTGSIEPRGYADVYVDTAEAKVYIANGLTNADWQEVGAGGAIVVEQRLPVTIEAGQYVFLTREDYGKIILVRQTTEPHVTVMMPPAWLPEDVNKSITVRPIGYESGDGKFTINITAFMAFVDIVASDASGWITFDKDAIPGFEDGQLDNWFAVNVGGGFMYIAADSGGVIEGGNIKLYMKDGWGEEGPPAPGTTFMIVNTLCDSNGGSETGRDLLLMGGRPPYGFLETSRGGDSAQLTLAWERLESFPIEMTTPHQWVVTAQTSVEHGAQHLTGDNDPIPEATVMSAGLMSAADKAKLDALDQPIKLIGEISEGSGFPALEDRIAGYAWFIAPDAPSEGITDDVEGGTGETYYATQEIVWVSGDDFYYGSGEWVLLGTSPYMTGTTSPAGVVTPRYPMDLYLDTVAGSAYIAAGTTSSDWVKMGDHQTLANRNTYGAHNLGDVAVLPWNTSGAQSPAMTLAGYSLQWNTTLNAGTANLPAISPSDQGKVLIISCQGTQYDLTISGSSGDTIYAPTGAGLASITIKDGQTVILMADYNGGNERWIVISKTPPKQLQGTVSPIGTVTPNEAGIRYYDTVALALYESIGTTSADWVLV